MTVMNAAQTVDRIVFDLGAGSAPQARIVQDRVSAFARQRLPDLLAQVLDAFPGQAWSFDAIELDLGAIPETGLEQHLADKIATALKNFLLRNLPLQRSQAAIAGDRLAQPGNAGNADSVQTLQRLRQLLDGAGAPDADAVGQLLQTLLTAWPNALIVLLRDLGRKQTVRKRLAQLSSAVMAQLVQVLEPSEAKWIVAYAADVEQAHQRRALVAESRPNFRVAIWEFILSYLLLERGSYFNTKAMVAHTLLRMAGRYGIAYAELLRRLMDCIDVRDLPDAGRDQLPAILLALHKEAVPSGGYVDGGAANFQRSAAAGFDRAESMSEARRTLADFSWFLQHGVLPPGANGGDAAALTALLLEQDPDQLAQLLRQIGHLQSVRRRLAAQLPQQQLAQLVACLEARDAGWIVAAVDAMQEMHVRKPVVREQASRFKRQLWEFVFSALLVRRGSYFNQRSFVKSLLQQMAARYGVDYQELLLELIAKTLPENTPSAPASALPSILLALRDEAAEALPPPAADIRLAVPLHAPQFEQAARDFAALSARLDRGSDFNNRSYLDSVVRRLSARYGIAYLELLQLLQSPQVLAGTESGAKNGPGNKTAGVAGILSALQQDAQQKAAQSAGGLPGQSEQSGRQIDLDPVLHFLRHGHLPESESGESGASGASGSSAAALQQLLARGLNGGGVQLGRQLLALVGQGASAAAVTERLLHYLPLPGLLQLLGQLSPNFAGLIDTYLLAAAGAAGEQRTSRLTTQSRGAWRAVLRFLFAAGNAPFTIERLLVDTGKVLARRQGATPTLYRAGLLQWARQRAGALPRYQALVDLIEKIDGAGTAHGRMPLAGAGNQAGSAGAGNTDPAELALEWLDRILRYGMHAALADDGEGLDEAAISERIAQAMALRPVLFRQLLLRAIGRPLERLRIVHLPPDLRRAAIRLIAGEPHDIREWWQAALVHSAETEARAGAASTGLWQAAIAEQLLLALHKGRSSGLDIEVFLSMALRHLILRHRLLPAPLLQHLRNEIQRRPPGRPGAQQRLLDRVEKNLRKQPAAPSLNTPPPKRARPSPAAARPAEKELSALPAGLSFPIGNAGQVLLSPFLQQYFGRLDLLDGAEFVSFTHRSRAVYLLQYLVTGVIEAPEQDLLLNKILCGMDTVESPEFDGDPSDRERAVSAELLGTIAHHWEKLRNNGPDSLQQCFLHRAGRLTHGDDQWRLKVESAALDVLLPSYPWPYSNIRFSWMKTVVKVEWK